MNTRMKTFAIVLLFLLGSIVLGIFLAWPIQWLWNNALVGSINGVNPIGFWQAYGIFLLSSLLSRNSVNAGSKDK